MALLKSHKILLFMAMLSLIVIISGCGDSNGTERVLEPSIAVNEESGVDDISTNANGITAERHFHA